METKQHSFLVFRGDGNECDGLPPTQRPTFALLRNNACCYHNKIRGVTMIDMVARFFNHEIGWLPLSSGPSYLCVKSLGHNIK